MRKALVTAVLVAFATLNAMDSICCPDGCTNDQETPVEHQSPESPDGVCILCLGGVDSAIHHALSPCAIVTTRVAPVHLTPRLDAPTAPLEHPPRF